MKYHHFSNADAMPMLGLGTWKSAQGEVYAVVRKAIELGYRHFDCAHVYGNEHEIGQAISDAISNGELQRSDLWITSKLWNNRHRSEHIREACELSLKNLKLDYLDLYLIHWPVALSYDLNYPQTAHDMVSLSEVPLSETWQGLVALKNAHLARHIGVSNFSINKIEEITQHSGVKPEVLQLELHPFLQQQRLLDYAKQQDILLTGFCPLGSADRPANRIVDGEPKLFENAVLLAMATAKGCTPAQVMLAWAVCRGTAVIPKSVNSERLKENLAAADIELTEAEMQQLSKLDRAYRYIKGDFWCLEGSDYTIQNLWDE